MGLSAAQVLNLCEGGLMLSKSAVCLQVSVAFQCEKNKSKQKFLGFSDSDTCLFQDQRINADSCILLASKGSGSH